MSRKRRTFPGLGSISSGTLKISELLDTFEWYCRTYGGRKGRKLAREYADLPMGTDHWDLNVADDLLTDMFDLLDSLAPDYVHFSAHEDDGADFGFWPSWESLEYDARAGEVLKVADLSEVPSSWRGIVLHVNDHGNATVYRRAGNHRLTELWSCV